MEEIKYVEKDGGLSIKSIDCGSFEIQFENGKVENFNGVPGYYVKDSAEAVIKYLKSKNLRGEYSLICNGCDIKVNANSDLVKVMADYHYFMKQEKDGVDSSNIDLD